MQQQRVGHAQFRIEQIENDYNNNTFNFCNNMNITEINQIVVNKSNQFATGNEELYREAYNFIDRKIASGNCITQPEYKFLCWLNFNDEERFPITIHKPHIPKVRDISLNDFYLSFCQNAHRMRLFIKLEDYLRMKNEVLNCEYMDVLIGGSFTDKSTERPHDIDFAILLDGVTIVNYPGVCDPQYYTDDELNPEFLERECSYKNYFNYIWLAMLGNIAEIKDKDNVHCIKDNSFVKRNIYRVKFSRSVLCL